MSELATTMQKITPFLWFDSQAEEAAQFYTSIFADGKITAVTRFGKAGVEYHGKPNGSVMTVAFELMGQQFTALNGGPHVTFNHAISLVVSCDTQEEVDHYWSRLGEGGQEQMCGWINDKYGLSWQIVPKAFVDMMQDENSERRERVLQAMFGMKKFDIAGLRQAYEG
jgi:predicted 3-demethylubiquinone-9 3-methyltransferase (glyoxalase superfamily)